MAPEVWTRKPSTGKAATYMGGAGLCALLAMRPEAKAAKEGTGPIPHAAALQGAITAVVAVLEGADADFIDGRPRCCGASWASGSLRLRVCHTAIRAYARNATFDDGGRRPHRHLRRARANKS